LTNILSNQWQLFWPNNNFQCHHFQSCSVFLNGIMAQTFSRISMLHKIKNLNTNNIHNSTQKWQNKTQGMKCEENTLNNHTHRYMVFSCINHLTSSFIGDGWGCELCLAIARFRSPLGTLALDYEHNN
jgi:hypothetical protein